MEELVVTEKRKSTAPPFLVKTYMLVEDPSTNDVVSWNSDGSAFVVWKPAEFSRDLLPTLFKHNNFSSFVRQLNTYGFRKVATTRWEFSNDMFRQGKREVLCQIRRRKASSNKQQARHHQNASRDQTATNRDHRLWEEEEQRSCSTSWSSGSLVDENKRLKEENGVLRSELVSMKRKCKELVDLVHHNKCNNNNNNNNNNNGDDDDEMRPKLFGVRLELVQQGEMDRKRKLLSQSCK